MDAEIEQSTATSNHTKNNKNNNSAHITKRYIYLGLKPVAVIDYNADNKANVYAIHTDYLGTPQAVTNAKQQVVWRAEYTPFGQIKNQQAVPLTVASDTTRNNQSNGFISTANAMADHNTQKSFEFNLRFAGQYEDQETGYYYNWHRYYNPETGRYLTPDPIGLQGGMNAYAYANHDPAMSVDPWGLKVWIAERPINGLLGNVGYLGSHTWLIIEPDNPEELWKISGIKIPMGTRYAHDFKIGDGTFTLGAYPGIPDNSGSWPLTRGNLTKYINNDPENGMRHKQEVKPPNHGPCFNRDGRSADTQFILDLLTAFNSYYDNLPYAGLLGAYEPNSIDYYNSNSFTYGLLIAAGVTDLPHLEKGQVGAGKPVKFGPLLSGSTKGLGEKISPFILESVRGTAEEEEQKKKNRIRAQDSLPPH